MTDVQALGRKITESGYLLRYVASRLGLTYAGFLKKMKGESDFKVGEMQNLADLLGMSDTERVAIFFAHSVDCERTKQEGASPCPN